VEENFPAAGGLVLFDEDWHPGVVGIVAGRISRKYNRPTIVLGNEGELAKGSGRGLNGFNLVEILGACSTCLENWGGHPMAVGITLQKRRIDEFRARFDEVIRAQEGEVAALGLELSGWIEATELNEQLMAGLEQLQPFGMGNPEPIFGVRGVRLRNRPDVFKEVHFRFAGEDAAGRRISGVAWKLAGPAAARGGAVGNGRAAELEPLQRPQGSPDRVAGLAPGGGDGALNRQNRACLAESAGIREGCFATLPCLKRC
jgi:single-stranded-DNA-specific exonuclease